MASFVASSSSTPSNSGSTVVSSFNLSPAGAAAGAAEGTGRGSAGGAAARVRQSVDDALAEADALCARPEDPGEPYKNKYAARVILQAAKATIRLPKPEKATSSFSEGHKKETDEGEDGQAKGVKGEEEEEEEEVWEARAQRARIDLRVGRISMDVEEMHEADTSLEAAVEAFDDGLCGRVLATAGDEIMDDEARARLGRLNEDGEMVANLQDLKAGAASAEGADSMPMARVTRQVVRHSATLIDALNILGVLWSTREHMRRSLLYLVAAFKLYKTVHHLRDGRTDGPRAIEGVSAAVRSSSVRMDALREEAARALAVDEDLWAFEQKHTYTLFYMAQAYASLEEPGLSAWYCHLTLERQLSELMPQAESSGSQPVKREFSKKEWVSNCLNLADYFMAQEMFRQASYYIQTAEAVWEWAGGIEDAKHPEKQENAGQTEEDDDDEDEPEEVARRLVADIQRRRGLLFASVLKHAHARHMNQLHYGGELQNDEDEDDDANDDNADADLDDGGNESKAATAAASTAGVDALGDVITRNDGLTTAVAEDDVLVGDKAHAKHFRFSFVFASDVPLPEGTDDVHIRIAPLAPKLFRPTRIVRGGFDSAKEVFKLALGAVHQAKAYFALDGYVSDHVELRMELSQLYRCIAGFEPDLARRIAMYTRRVENLLPLLLELNPRVYVNFHKQIAFELGEVFMELLDMKQQRVLVKARKYIRKVRKQNPSFAMGMNEDDIQALMLSGVVDAADVEAANDVCARSVLCFVHFARMYSNDADQPVLASLPSAVEALERSKALPEVTGSSTPSVASIGLNRANLVAGDVDALLKSHFFVARLLGKFVDQESPVDPLVRSMRQYEALLPFARDLLEAKKAELPVGTFSDELSICEQMSSLLPTKIDRLHQQLSNRGR